MVQEEKVSKTPSLNKELSKMPVPKSVDDLASTLVPSVPVVPPPVPLAVPVVPAPPTPLPLLQPLIPPPPIIPRIASVPRPLAPLPVRPSITRPPPLPQKDEENGSESNSSDGDLGSKRMDYEISEESRQAQERQEKAMQELSMMHRARALAVPTSDKSVCSLLRLLGEPITVFGDKEMERRDRLRMIMAKLVSEGHSEMLLKAHEESAASAEAEDDDGQGPHTYPFYTEGSKALLDARIKIAKYSIVRAAHRLERQRRKRADPDEDPDAEMDLTLRGAGIFTLDCSDIGDDRPLTGCSFSHDGKLLAICAMSGVTKVWSMPQVNKVGPLKGHTERATDVAFSPVDNHIATASADSTAILWNPEGSLLRKFEGHLDRLARIAFHPSGKYLGTASFDKTWRLWDIDTGVELLLQEGHSRSVYGICFNTDGSLAGSCGLDALARVWDLRAGRNILALEGHVKPVFGISFSPNGHHLATGGEDNTCRIWDLRKRKCIYVIPAHSNLISQVKFEPEEGYFLATASYDMTAKIWSARDFKPIKTLSGHESKVTALDITGDGQCIATVSHDRTIKLWSCRTNEKEKAMDVDL